MELRGHRQGVLPQRKLAKGGYERHTAGANEEMGRIGAQVVYLARRSAPRSIEMRVNWYRMKVLSLLSAEEVRRVVPSLDLEGVKRLPKRKDWASYH